MKKRIVVFGAIAVMLLTMLIVWYNTAAGRMNLDADEVTEIVVFDGSTGTETRITDKAQIEHVIENLNSVKLKRGKLSVGSMGYRFRVTVCLSDGNTAGRWDQFMINSSNTIRKDPFFYTVVEGSIDYDYIASIVD